jgi:transmembrane sensor
MKKSNIIQSLSTNLDDFLDRQRNLSFFEKRMDAGAVIDEISTIDSSYAFLKVKHRIEKKDNVIDFFRVLTRVAAILTIPLLALTIWSLFLREKPVEQSVTDLTWQELQTPAGMRSQVVLPDGTKMWLNAESKIRYSIPFTSGFRTIELTGEAFLDVAKNESSPFVVKSGGTTIQVTGTEFNLKSYPDEDQLEVALLEGSVKFSFTSKNNQQKYIALKPGDYLTFYKVYETIRKTNTNLEKFVAWHYNTLVLDETPMEEVARLLERWYGVKVTLVGQDLKKYKFTTTFENESISQVLELIELSSPIRIKYVPGKFHRETGQTEKANVIIMQKPKV